MRLSSTKSTEDSKFYFLLVSLSLADYFLHNMNPYFGHSRTLWVWPAWTCRSRFYIQILFWMEGTTDIHQHEFSGAFHVMQGSSVHSEFEFHEAHKITPHIRTGDLSSNKIELLETRLTIPITSGKACIHSLFHLDTPSVTVVVRTHNDPGPGPQYNYLPPHIAIDPVQEDALTMRRKQLLDILENTDHPSYATQVNDMIQALDFERGFHTLHHAMDRLIALGEWQSTLSLFQMKHGELANGVSTTLTENLRRGIITQMRHYIENPEHRFFLALLMNVQDRKDIFKLITTHYPDQPASETIIRWAEQILWLRSDLFIYICDYFILVKQLWVRYAYGLYITKWWNLIKSMWMACWLRLR